MTSILHQLSSLMKEYPGITNPYDLLILKQYKSKAFHLSSSSNNTNKKRQDWFAPQNITKESLLLSDSSSKDLLSNFFGVATQHSSLIRHQQETNNTPGENDNDNDHHTHNIKNSSRGEDTIDPTMTVHGIPVKDMHLYVEKLTKRIVHRPPTYEHMNNEFHSLLVRLTPSLSPR